MIKRVFVVTLLASGSFLGNFPLSAMEPENICKNVSARRAPHRSKEDLKVEEEFKEDHPQSKTLEETIRHIDEALEKKVGEDQRTLRCFSEIKELYANGKRDAARLEYLMMVGISNPRKDQKNKVVSLEEQIGYISQLYRTTMKLTTNFKFFLDPGNEENTKHRGENMEAYIIQVAIKSFVKAVWAQFYIINKQSEELHLPVNYNFLKDYLLEIKNKKIIFLKQLSSQIAPFAEKKFLEQDPSTTSAYEDQFFSLLYKGLQGTIDEKEREDNKLTLENKENNKSTKKKSKKKKKRHLKGKSRKTKTQSISEEEVAPLRTNPSTDSHTSPLPVEESQNAEEEEILVSASPQPQQTDPLESSEEKESKDELLSEVEDQQTQLQSGKNEDAPKVKRKLKSAKKEKLDREQPNIDSEEKTTDKKNKKGKLRKALDIKKYLKRQKQKESSSSPSVVHTAPHPSISFTKKAKKQLEKIRADYVRKKIQALVVQLNSNPVGTGGIGKPERLARGGYSRRVTGGRRVVYDIEDSGNIVVYNTEGYHKN